MDKILLIVGCSVFVILGAWHGFLVLFSSVFEPEDKSLLETLKNSTTKITKTGSIWGGVQGFHLSHSLGLIAFGVFFIVLAIENYAYLRSSLMLNAGMIVVSVAYIFLASKYWFNVPRNAFIVAFGFLLMSLILR